MDLAAVVAAWVVALVTSTGVALVVSRGTTGDDINTPTLGGVPIAAPIITLAGAILHVTYLVQNAPLDEPFGGAIYPLVWSGVCAVIWLLAALLTRGRSGAETREDS